jgi:hypothetical protein
VSLNDAKWPTKLWMSLQQINNNDDDDDDDEGSEVDLAVPRSPLTLTVIELASSIPAGHLFVCL